MGYTTYWINCYLALKAALETAIEALEDADGDPLFKAVYFGKKAQPEEFMCCIFWPVVITPRVTTVTSSEYPIGFRITVIAKSAEVQAGHVEAISALGAISNMLVDDRQFDHLADTTEIILIDPDVERRRVRTRHESAMVVVFERFVLPK